MKWPSLLIALLILLSVDSTIHGQASMYSTLVGGTDLDISWIHAGLTTDAQGNIYVAATTRSNDFPTTPGAYREDYAGGTSDVVICKFSPDLSTLIAATYLGGTSTDEPCAIVQDGDGHIIVGGHTYSTDFPSTAGSFRESKTGNFDFFIAKFDDDLSDLLEATYLGGTGFEIRCDLAIDENGDVFISGTTGSVDFPILPGAYDPSRTTTRDVCIAKLNSDLSSLLASTYFGPEAIDGWPAIDLDQSGNIVIAGSTTSGAFPTTAGAYQETSHGDLEIHVSKLSSDLTSLIASTYFGSSSYEMAFGVIVDTNDDIYIVGHPGPGFPTTPGAFSPFFNGGVADAGIAKFSDDLTTLLASTYVGGSSNDAGIGIGLGSDGTVTISGYTSSENFPTGPKSIYPSLKGGDDAFIATLSADLSTLVATTLMGGSSTEEGNALLVTSGGRILLAGSTSSADFPATAGAYDESYNGKGTSGEFWGGDLFVSSMAFPQFTRISSGQHVTSGGPSQAVSWADFDLDGYPDLVVTNMLYPAGCDNWLYDNDGTGSFQELEASSVSSDGGASRAATWGDYDNDGDPDLYISNLLSNTNFLYNNDNGTFTRVVGSPATNNPASSTSASWVDYDNDGNLDLFVSSYGPNLLYRNDGSEFVRVLDAGPIVTDNFDSYTAVWSDYDNDGWTDLFVAVVGEGSPNKNNHLYRNNGDGTFSSISGQPIVTDGGASIGASWGDFDNDGDQDIFVSNPGLANNYLYRNDGDGTFSKITQGSIVTDVGYSMGSAWGDYDNDGDLDLFVSNYVYGSSGVNFLYNNDGTGNFDRVVGEAIATYTTGSIGAAWSDFDRDGDLDLFVANSQNDNENNTFYVNAGSSNRWISIALVGTESNRSAFGAKVRLKAIIDGQAIWQMREVSAQSGYCGQNELNVHFGLGDVDAADSIKIEWPSGVVEVLESVPSNQFMIITEGDYSDFDGDGLIGLADNCPAVYNPDQADGNSDGIGDACCCQRRVGDANGQGDYPDEVTLGDIMLMVDVLFISNDCTKLACPDEADVNQSGGANPPQASCLDYVSLGDIMTLVDFLFITGPETAVLPDCL
jgi:hypothetical protein